MAALPSVAKQQLRRRLARLEGQVAGVRGMVREGPSAVAVLTQLTAVQGALDAVAYAVIDHHARRCLIAGAPDETAVSVRLTELLAALDALLRHRPHPRAQEILP